MPDRLTLVHAIWDSIALEQKAVPLSESQLAEIRRRAARHDAGEVQAIPWEQVQAETRARLKT